MSSKYYSFSNPSEKPLKILIGAVALFSIVAAFTHYIISFTFEVPSFYQLFSLSSSGMSRYFIWQLFTNFFIIPSSGHFFSFILHLVFSTYTLYFISHSLAQIKGYTSVYKIFFLGGFLSSLAAWGILQMQSPFAHFCGFQPALFSLLVAWMFLLPEQSLLYLVLPLRVKWLVAILVIPSLLGDIANGDLTTFCASLSGCLVGYFYGLIGWRTTSSIQFLEGFEKGVLKTIGAPSYRNTRSYTSGSPSSEEQQFLDAMLDKIASQGQDSLTWLEKWKLKRIFRKKRSR